MHALFQRSFTALLLALALLPACAELQLAKVAADKVFYAPGETAEITVTVKNPDDAAAAATLRVEVVSDLEAACDGVGEQAITVPGKGEQTVTLP